MDWFLAIKCAKMKLLRVDFPDLSEDEVSLLIRPPKQTDLNMGSYLFTYFLLTKA